MSAAYSTIKEKALFPYWTESSAGISSRLWLPTEIVLSGLDSTSLLTSSSGTGVKSWFSTTSYQAPKKSLPATLSVSSIFSLAESTDYADTAIKSRRIRLYPDAKQKQLLREWFGCGRWVYNATLDYIRDNPGTIRPLTVKKTILSLLPEWSGPVPYQIKAQAAKDACHTVMRAKKKCKETGKPSNPKYKRRGDTRQSVYIPALAVKANGAYVRLLGKMKTYEAIPSSPRDSRLIFENNRYYLCVPYEVNNHKAENQGRVVALDPGVRTFMAWYSQEGCGKLGESAMSRIVRLCKHLDSLYGRIAVARCRQKQRMRKAAARLRNKIHDLVDELHWKCARWLVDNFDIILLPTFETGDMARKVKRKIGRKSVRSMLTLRHYQFKLRIKQMASNVGKVVLDVCEAYTSKTVSWTGELVNIGGAKTIKSKLTGDVMDRDYNGARGIFLRALGDSPTAKAAHSLT